MRWTDEARVKQAEQIKEWKPWLKSTGPKTEEGKSASSMNALKGGAYSSDIKQLKATIAKLAVEF